MLRGARFVATLGFALLWFSGWGLARLTGVSLGSAYLSASMALSLLSMQLLIWSTERRSPELARAPGRIWAGRLAAVLSVAVIVLISCGLFVYFQKSMKTIKKSTKSREFGAAKHGGKIMFGISPCICQLLMIVNLTNICY